MRFLTFVLAFFQFFHVHIRSLLLIHESSLVNTLGVSANEKYPHHPIIYRLSFFIRLSMESGFFLEVISRILSFIRSMLTLAIRTVGSLCGVKLNPRNFLFQGRSTADLLRLTFNLS